MRRLFLLATAPLLAVAVGCCHSHGVCDCDDTPVLTTGVPHPPPPPVIKRIDAAAGVGAAPADPATPKVADQAAPKVADKAPTQLPKGEDE
jgi:hypothetical protein